MELGTILAQLRNQKGLNQREFAQALGVSNGAVAMWETNKRLPDLEMIKKLSSYFNVSVDYLLGLKKTNCESNDCYNYFYEEGDANWNMKKIAAAKNISHDEILEKSCIDKDRFEMLWFANAQPIAEELIRIAHVLDVSIDYLLDNSQHEKISIDEEIILRYYHKLPDEVMELLESFCSLEKKKERSIVLGKCFELERDNSSVAAEENSENKQGKSLA